MKQESLLTNHYNLAWEITSPLKNQFWRWFSIPKLGYVSSLRFPTGVYRDHKKTLLIFLSFFIRPRSCCVCATATRMVHLAWMSWRHSISHLEFTVNLLNGEVCGGSRKHREESVLWLGGLQKTTSFFIVHYRSRHVSFFFWVNPEKCSGISSRYIVHW